MLAPPARRKNTNAAGLSLLDISSSGSYATLYGDMAEIMIYNSALNTADRNTVECYLNTKYAFGISDFSDFSDF